MNSYARLSLATCACILLSHFSSQDSTGGGKPNVNFHGTITDLRETFKAENITIDRLYKAIPAYQQPPADTTKPNNSSSKNQASEQDKNTPPAEDDKNKKNEPVIDRSYDPSDNITRLDLSEILKITVSPNQKPQKFGNRDYIVMEVTSKNAEQSKNSYIIEADKRVFFDQQNSAGPIEKEIKFRSMTEITLDGYKQQEAESLQKKSVKQPTQTAQATSSKTKRLFSYVKNAFTLKMSL